MHPGTCHSAAGLHEAVQIAPQPEKITHTEETTLKLQLGMLHMIKFVGAASHTTPLLVLKHRYWKGYAILKTSQSIEKYI